MSFDPHSRRFDPRCLFPAIETDGEGTSDAPDVSSFSWDEECANISTERDFDEALKQVASERCCVCPLCGANVGRDGSVLSSGPSGPISPQSSTRPNPIGRSWWAIGVGLTIQRWFRRGGRRLLD